MVIVCFETPEPLGGGVVTFNDRFLRRLVFILLRIMQVDGIGMVAMYIARSKWWRIGFDMVSTSVVSVVSWHVFLHSLFENMWQSCVGCWSRHGFISRSFLRNNAV